MSRRIAILAVLLSVAEGRAISSISATNRHAYLANAGWIDARADTTNGAVVGAFFCSGWMWSANLGWISLGGGVPTNGWRYGNTATNDWGVNHTGAGQLRGCAWSPNAGWISFEDSGQPAVDLLTGQLSGFAYGANLGWISLSNASAHVQTMFLAPGPDADGDGLPDAWEMKWAGNIFALDGKSDPDGDGCSNRDEYRADTDPLDPADLLAIVATEPGEDSVSVVWPARPTRLYDVERTDTFDRPWFTALSNLLVTAVGPTTQTVQTADWPKLFQRVRARIPLSPENP